MIDFISDIFANIGYLLELINCLLLLNGISKKSKEHKVFFVYCLLIFIIQIITKILFDLSLNNIFLSHFYFVTQFVLLSYFYYLLLNDTFQKKLIKIVTVVCLSLLGIQYAVYPSKFFTFNLFEIFIMSLPLMIYTTFHLYNLLNEKKYFYYINIGLLLYLFGSTVVFLSYRLLSLIATKEIINITWSLNIYMYVIYQLFILKELIPKKI
ncbi:hypothetical protein BC748_0720 [Flavobacterium dankookense]|uniref:YhhN-like protein n=2 Tax=Flavobacterium dankookense TaxID=706186 RepID=A0A4R6QFG3_9FLAO|nr:hypothetical protein BC748_0720 [Flavobacterium dankookense]